MYTSVNKKNILISFIFYLTLVLIAFGSVGDGINNNKTISFGFMYIICIVIFLYKSELSYFFNKRLLLFIMLFFLSGILSNCFSEYSSMLIWYRFFSIFLCFLLGFISYILLSKNIVSFGGIISSIAIFSVVHVLILVLMWYVLDDPYTYNWVSGLPFFNNIRNFTDFLSIGYLCSIILFYISNYEKKIIWYICGVVILSAIVWSGSRTALLSVFVSFVVFFFFIEDKIKYFILVILNLFFSLVISLFFKLNNNSLGFSAGVYRSLDNNINNISSGRVDLYAYIINHIFENPVLGLGGEAVYMLRQQFNFFPAIQAHNSILQILIEFGFLGLFLFICICVVIKIDIKNKIDDVKHKILIILITNIIAASFFNGGFYYVVTISLLCIFISILYYFAALKIFSSVNIK